MAKEFKESNKEPRESKKKGAASVSSAIEQDQDQTQSFSQNTSESQSSASNESTQQRGSGAASFRSLKSSVENLRGLFSQENMNRARDSVVQQVNQRPFVTLSAVLGAGYLIGSVMPRRIEKYLFSFAGASALDWITGRNQSPSGLKAGISNVLNMKGESNEQFGASH